MRYAVAFLVVLIAAVPSLMAADPPSKDDEMKELDAHIDNALAFLQKTQLTDGGWMAGMNLRFGGAAATEPTRPYRASVSWPSWRPATSPARASTAPPSRRKHSASVLPTASKPNGLIAGGAAAGNQEMYTHGISTLMLAEAAGMTDGKLAEDILQARSTTR